MGVSMIDVQHEGILNAIRDAGRGKDWKVLVVDQGSWKLINNVVKEDDILMNLPISNIEHIEQRRQRNNEMEAIYLLTPEAHIVDCLMADLEQKRYRRASLLWTSLLHSSLRQRIDKSPMAQSQINDYRVLNIGYYPRESNLITLRDPWSFPVLYHPACNNLVRQHISELAQKIVAVCVSLGEYPTIRYLKTRSPTHEAGVLCTHLARFVQDEIDRYATYNNDFPPPSSRPRATLYILDRSLDLVAPLVHEFTYQAMVHDLLRINDGEKVTFRMMTEDGKGKQEKDVEITEKDKLWIENRHQHMKDTIEKLMNDFQRFMAQNPHFTNADTSNTNNLNDIKDMLAGLPQFQEMKESYSLHLTMAQESMNLFQERKLPDLASVEQSLATGLDEDYKKAKNMADQVVRTLDEESIIKADRLRLILLYLLYRDGLLQGDIAKLLQHAQLPPQDGDVIRNLALLGAKTTRNLKDPKPQPSPLFSMNHTRINKQEDYSLSRFEPALKTLLNEHVRNTLDQEVFPFTKPQLEGGDMNGPEISHSSLRSAKPTWASSKGRGVTTENKQRVIIFMGGGATYSEARTCYETTQGTNRDVYLMTSHMLTPNLFLRQVADLSAERRRLNLPVDQPKPQAPAHLFEPEPKPQPPPQNQSQPPPPPTEQMAKMNISSANGSSNQQKPQQGSKSSHNETSHSEKKKRHFFLPKKS